MRTDDLIERLVDLQIRRPWVPLAVAAAISAVFGYYASKLELRTRYEVLLPDREPSVQELHRLEARTSAAQTVLVVLESGEATGPGGAGGRPLRAMGDALVARLRALGPGIVSSAEDGVHETRAFLAPRAALFLDLDDLRRLAADVEARWAYDVEKATGLALVEEDPPPPLDAEAIEARFRSRRKDLDRYPDGYYEAADGKALIVVARSPIAGGDLATIGPALRRIEELVASVQASNPDFHSVRVSYAGTMPTGFREFGVVRDDLLSVGFLGIALVLAAVLLYFLRLRALLVMAITIGVGLLWTFGLTAIVLGHLNMATAFLISIVAGNGINVGILYQARYFEQRARGDAPAVALKTAVHATWVPTVIAAVAAAASYGSLLATDFRAFRDFGFITGAGMLLCWVVKTLLVPPLLVLLDRDASARPRRLQRFEMSYGKPFGWLVPKAPSLVVALGVAVAVAGTVAALAYVGGDPLEYDIDRVQNDRSTDPGLHHAWAVASRVLGGGPGAMAILTDAPSQARELETALRARWESAPAGAKPFVAVHSVWDLVPDGQQAKLPLARTLGKRIAQAHRRGLIGAKEWASLAELVPPGDLQAFGLADLPEEAARPFSERDGTRGTLVLVEAEPASSNDLRYLLRYADAFRETRLSSGAVVRGSGTAVIFADMLAAVVRDIPIAVSLSLGLTLIAVFLAFRRGAQTLAVLFTLLTATAGVAAFLYLARVKLNFLNFVALPISFGIGVDYAVNVAQRYHADGGTDIVGTLRSSGGAVVLCSLTTMLGYLALLGSHNLGIRSLGVTAFVGEVSCLLAAVVFLPSLYLVLERRRSSLEPRAVPSEPGPVSR